MSQDTDQSYMAQALPSFIAEAHEQVAGIEQLLLQLEVDPGQRDLLDALFRCAHTVKGTAGIFGLDDIVAFTHHVETLLDRVREGTVALTPSLSTLLLRCNDQIRKLVDAAGAGDGAGAASDAAVRADLVTALIGAGGGSTHVPPQAPIGSTAGAAPGSAMSRWQIAVQFDEHTFRNGMDPVAILTYLAGMGSVAHIACHVAAVPALDVLDAESCHLAFELALVTEASRAEIESAFTFVQDDARITIEGPTPSVPGPTDAPSLPAPAAAADAVASAAPAGARAPTAAVSEEHRLIRVAADRLDAVINLVGELVIASAGASLLAHQNGNAALVEANSQIAQLVEEIRNGALQLRMVPIGDTFARFRRLVRDTAADLGKDVQLDISGGDTELDKSIVERIADPLTHLVRNALDHGLESPSQREAAGKPAFGRLSLAAFHESGSIVIRISDDGRGIHRRKVLERAWERGLVERGITPPDPAILGLIFEPGFSTAEQVTNLSGRGVGMDVVRRNIEALRGSVQIASVEGQGSTIEIRLPLTLAIIDGFLVGVGDAKFVFPLDAVVEVVESRAPPGYVDDRGRSIVELRGQVLPVIDLRRLYQLDSVEPARGSIVVIQSGAARYGVRVDALLGQHQTVIKPLGRLFRSLRGMSGSSILGNGEVALIFDAASLAQLASDSPLRSPVAGTSPTSLEGQPS